MNYFFTAFALIDIAIPLFLAAGLVFSLEARGIAKESLVVDGRYMPPLRSSITSGLLAYIVLQFSKPLAIAVLSAVFIYALVERVLVGSDK